MMQLSSLVFSVLLCVAFLFLLELKFSKIVFLKSTEDTGFRLFKTQVPIYYINLDRSAERRIYMEKAFNNTGKLIRVPAVDGTSDSLSDYVRNITKVMAVAKCAKNELALTASHMRAIKAAYFSGAPAAVIMEDDTSPMAAPFWTISLDELVNVANEQKPGWELIRLQHTIATYKGQKDALRYWRENPFEEFLRVHHFSYGMVAYMISKDGMKYLVETLVDEDGKFDCLAQNVSSSCIADFLFPKVLKRTYLKSPPMFVTRVFEDSTGVRTGKSGRKVNDQWRYHYEAVLRSMSWIVQAHEIRKYSSNPATEAANFPFVSLSLTIDETE